MDYEPTSIDREAALRQAQRIATWAVANRTDVEIEDAELEAILTAKIEAAILSEMVMRGTAEAERR